MPGVCNAFGYTLDWQQRYRLIKAAGFDSVMLWWSDGFGRGPGYRQDVRRARNAGLVVENIHTPVRWRSFTGIASWTAHTTRRLLWWCICLGTHTRWAAWVWTG